MGFSCMRSLPLLLALTTFSLVGLFYLLKPVAPQSGQITATADAGAAGDAPVPAAQLSDDADGVNPEVVVAASSAGVEERFEVAKGQRVLGPDRIIARQGQQVQIEVLSDRDDELHLHGYDLHLPLLAGKAVTLTLRADHSGRFELELHKQHLTLAALEVHPD